MSLTLIDAPSPNFNERLHPLDMLVLHYTGMKDGPAALARMQEEKEPRVSAHYMVERTAPSRWKTISASSRPTIIRGTNRWRSTPLCAPALSR